MAFSEMVFQHYNINCGVNIARKVKCYISKSKLALSECNEGLFECDSLYGFYAT